MLPGRGALRLIALLPLFAPSLVQALGIVFLFGRNGLINRTFDLALDVYGFWGIVVSDVLYAFPHAFLILSAALAVGDARHYESARMLGASPWRIFRTITVPATRYGLASATLISGARITPEPVPRCSASRSPVPSTMPPRPA